MEEMKEGRDNVREGDPMGWKMKGCWDREGRRMRKKEWDELFLLLSLF